MTKNWINVLIQNGCFSIIMFISITNLPHKYAFVFFDFIAWLCGFHTKKFMGNLNSSTQSRKSQCLSVLSNV